MNLVAVVDYGMGNLRSVCKAVEHVDKSARVVLTHDINEVRRADRVIFPGQGAIAGCLKALDERGLREGLLDAIRNKPFLGICLGLQALYEFSEEGGGLEGLGLFRGKVRRFPSAMQDPKTGLVLKVPHMGWNQVHQTRKHPLWKGIMQDTRFYFVHSFYAESADAETAIGTTDYGLSFTSAAAWENILAVQFHPEKSQQAGLRLLKNFLTWDA